MNPEHTDLLTTIIQAIVAYYAITAIFSVLVIGLFVFLVRKFMN